MEYNPILSKTCHRRAFCWYGNFHLNCCNHIVYKCMLLMYCISITSWLLIELEKVGNISKEIYEKKKHHSLGRIAKAINNYFQFFFHFEINLSKRSLGQKE